MPSRSAGLECAAELETQDFAYGSILGNSIPPSGLDPKTQEPETRNPKPETRNPKTNPANRA